MLRFVEFTPDNWRVDIHVSKEQERHVASRVTLQARAWAYRGEHARAYLICNDETPVGAVLWHDWDEAQQYVLSQFLIDERYQRQGLGYQAMCQVLDTLAMEARYAQVVLCYTVGNEAAHRLYAKLGFVDVAHDAEDEEDDEPCMLLSLDTWREKRTATPTTK